jgi:hypothetical protein
MYIWYNEYTFHSHYCMWCIVALQTLKPNTETQVLKEMSQKVVTWYMAPRDEMMILELWIWGSLLKKRSFWQKKKTISDTNQPKKL